MKRNPNTHKLPTITVSEEIHKEIRILAAIDNLSLQAVGERLIRRGLDAQREEARSVSQ